MKKLKCYYAHTMLSYGSTIEDEDIKLLERLGFEVINPSSPEIVQACSNFIKNFGKTNVMEFFAEIINSCDVVAFRSLPDGKILSGIVAEIQHALNNDIPVIEIPCLIENRMLDYPETKKYLTQIGFYKIKN